jgi:hypothetical protein
MDGMANPGERSINIVTEDKPKVLEGLDQKGTVAGTRISHIPANLVVDQWASDGESHSHRDFLSLHDVGTTSEHLSGYEITPTISMA